MVIRSITVKNFRQYRGVQSIRFADDPEKNVTVILGLNTSGKTTLVQAFNWALFGKVSFTTKDVLLNYDVSYDMAVGATETVEVEVALVHNKLEYIVMRSQVYRCDTLGALRPDNVRLHLMIKDPEGKTRAIKNPTEIDKAINDILPEDLSDYFFFDGERIESIGHRPELTEAVRSLLGLSVLDRVRQHLDPKRAGSVIGKLQKSLDNTGSQRASEALAQMERAQEALGHVTRRLEEIDKEIGHFEGEQEALQQTLLDNQETASRQQRKRQVEADIDREEHLIEIRHRKFLENFNDNAFVLFCRPLMVRALDLLQNTDLHDTGVPNMNATSIDFLIRRQRCICGSVITVDTPIYQTLLRERTLLPPESLGTVIRTFRRTAAAFNESVPALGVNIDDAYREMYAMRETLREHRDIVEDLSRSLTNSLDMGKQEVRVREVKEKLRQLRKEKDQLLNKRGAESRTIETSQRAHEDYVRTSEKNRAISRSIRYAGAIFEWIIETYQQKEEDIRDRLEERVNAIFTQMYHGHRTVSIDDHYRVKLQTAVGDSLLRTDESRGLETVKNFAFVAALVDLARRKIVTELGDPAADLGSEPYPLVMDAPFSNADERHVSSISAILPTIAEQVIMVLMDKDWQYAKQTLAPRVGMMYELDKRSETLTDIREVLDRV